METLIQSFLGIAARLNSPIHIRYWERQGEPTRSSRNGKEGELAAQTGSNGRKTSHVIIRQPYLFLEPVVRSFFEGAEDVRVISDRRFRERRQAPAGGGEPTNPREGSPGLRSHAGHPHHCRSVRAADA